MTEQGEYGVGAKPGADVESHEFVKWAKRMMDSIAVGGSWAVPRSGLIFEKRGENHLVLVAIADDLDRFQDEDGRRLVYEDTVDQLEDFTTIRMYMELAGVRVTNETTLGKA